MTSAFVPCLPDVSLDSVPLPQPRPYSIPLQATVGLVSWRTANGSSSARQDWQPTLDGRMNITVGANSSLIGKRYRVVSVLGEGTSAQVLLAQDEFQGRKLVAIKMLKRQFFFAGQKEARLMRWLAWKAPLAAVPRLQDFLVQKTQVCLVMDQLYQSLLDVIVQASTWPREALLQHVRSIALHLLATVADFHQLGLVHADLKPQNILLKLPLQTDWNAFHASSLQIIDYGSAFAVASIDTGAVSFEAQSLPYRAPEVIRKEACGPPADIWSLGCIICELLLHQPQFPADSPTALLEMIQETLYAQPSKALQLTSEASHGRPQRSQVATEEAGAAAASSFVPQKGKLKSWVEGKSALYHDLAHLDSLVADFVFLMLREDPSQRATARQLLNHPFLAPLVPLRHFPLKATGTQPETVSMTIDQEVPMKRLENQSELVQKQAEPPRHHERTPRWGEGLPLPRNTAVPTLEVPQSRDPRKRVAAFGSDAEAAVNSGGGNDERSKTLAGSASRGPNPPDTLKEATPVGLHGSSPGNLEMRSSGRESQTSSEKGRKGSLVPYDSATEEERNAAEILGSLSSLPPSSWSTGGRRRMGASPGSKKGKETPQSKARAPKKRPSNKLAESKTSRLKVRKMKKDSQKGLTAPASSPVSKDPSRQRSRAPDVPMKKQSQLQKLLDIREGTAQRMAGSAPKSPEPRASREEQSLQSPWSLPHSAETKQTAYTKTIADSTAESPMTSWNPLLANTHSPPLSPPRIREVGKPGKAASHKSPAPPPASKKRKPDLPHSAHPQQPASDQEPQARVKRKRHSGKALTVKGEQGDGDEAIASEQNKRARPNVKPTGPKGGKAEVEPEPDELKRLPRSQQKADREALKQGDKQPKSRSRRPGGTAKSLPESPFGNIPKLSASKRSHAVDKEEHPRQKQLQTILTLPNDQPSSANSSAERHHGVLQRRISTRRPATPREWWKGGT